MSNSPYLQEPTIFLWLAVVKGEGDTGEVEKRAEEAKEAQRGGEAQNYKNIKLIWV